MAIPEDLSTGGSKIADSGVVFRFAVEDPAFGIEVQRTSDNGSSAPATTAYQVRERLPAGKFVFKDLIPLIEQNNWYRFKHIRLGFVDGEFTTDVCAIPVSLSRKPDPITPDFELTGQKLDTIFETDKVLKAGTGVVDTGTILVTDSTGGASSITKIIRLGHAELVPKRSDTAYELDDLAIFSASSGLGTEQAFNAPVVIPKGVTITKVEARIFRLNANSTMVVKFNKCSTDEVVTLAIMQGVTSTEWLGLGSSDMTEETSSECYSIDVTLAAPSTGDKSDARFQHFKVTYTMPSYDKTY